jgi:hypothetical protein
MQQDAEECWTNLLYTLRERLKVRPASLSNNTRSYFSIIRYSFTSTSSSLIHPGAVENVPLF